jgi:hypothetical protein
MGRKQKDLCNNDPFLSKVVDKVKALRRENPDEDPSLYEEKDACKFGLIKDSIDRFGDNFNDEHQWQKEVWSTALERRSDMPTGVKQEWMS